MLFVVSTYHGFPRKSFKIIITDVVFLYAVLTFTKLTLYLCDISETNTYFYYIFTIAFKICIENITKLPE